MISIFKNLLNSRFTRKKGQEVLSGGSQGLLESPSPEFLHYTVRTCVFSDHGNRRVGAIISNLNDYKLLAIYTHIRGKNYYTTEDALRLTKLVRRRLEKIIMKGLCYRPLFEPMYFKLCISFDHNTQNKDEIIQWYLTGLLKKYPLLNGHDFIRVERKSAKHTQYIMCWPCIRRGRIIRFCNHGAFIRQLTGLQNGDEEKIIH